MTENYVITTAEKAVKGRREFQKQLLDSKTESTVIFSNEAKDKVVSKWIYAGKNNGLFELQAGNLFISFTGCWIKRSAYALYQNLAS